MSSPVKYESPEWHRERARDLVSRARGFGMYGWWKRRRRQEMYLEALVNAVLGTSDQR